MLNFNSFRSDHSAVIGFMLSFVGKIQDHRKDESEWLRVSREPAGCHRRRGVTTHTPKQSHWQAGKEGKAADLGVSYWGVNGPKTILLLALTPLDVLKRKCQKDAQEVWRC